MAAMWMGTNCGWTRAQIRMVKPKMRLSTCDLQTTTTLRRWCSSRLATISSRLRQLAWSLEPHLI